MHHVREATGVPEAGSHARRREENAPRRETPTSNVGPAEAHRADVKTADTPVRTSSARDLPGTDEARVLVRRRETAEVGPTHRAHTTTTSRKANRERGAGRGALTHAC